MSRMNAAWSNEPQWVEALPPILKEPMTIAFGGAIVAHAIFFLGLPVVAGSEKQPDVQPVATTVLTDQEKAQIPPDLSQSQFSTGSLLPGSTSGLTMPPISSGTMPPAGTGSIASGGGFTFDTPPPITNNSNDSSAQLAEIRRQQERLESERQEQIKKIEIARKQATEKAEDAERAKTPPGPLPNVPVNPSNMPPGTVGEPTKPAEGKLSTNPTQPPSQPARPSDAEIIAAAPKGTYSFDPNGAGFEVSMKPNAFSKWYEIDPKAKEIYDRNAKIFEEEREPAKKVSPQPIEFFVDTQTKTLPYPTQIGDQPIAVIPDYVQKVQEKKGYGTAVVQIAINGKGELASDPNIMQSTGYKILDQYVIAYVKSRKFPVLGRGQLYFMRVPIDPPVNKPVS